MAEKNPKTGKPWTEAEDRAQDRKRGIKEGSARDEVIDRRRGLPEEPGKGGGNRRVGKGQGPPMPPPGGGAMPMPTPPPGGAMPAVTPPMGAAGPGGMPLPPGVRRPRPRRRPVARPPAPMPAASRAPMLPGVGGGKGKIGGSGQRDPKGNYRAGTNSAGKKVGSGGKGKR